MILRRRNIRVQIEYCQKISGRSGRVSGTRQTLLGPPKVMFSMQGYSPLAQNQYMGFKVVLSKPFKMTNKQKYLCKAHNCVQNLGGAHISNVIFLILLLLFCCFMCVGIPTHVKYNAIFLIFPM